MLIQEYDKRWKAQYQAIVNAISQVTTDLDIGFEHVGSTSVPGLKAKPIIDIDMVYADDRMFALLTERLATIGCFHNGNQDVPGREVFKRGPGPHAPSILDAVRHHLYACPADNTELARHLAFRDFLRGNEWARAEYAELEIAITRQADQDHKTYAAIKEQAARSFVVKILELAGGPGYD